MNARRRTITLAAAAALAGLLTAAPASGSGAEPSVETGRLETPIGDRVFRLAVRVFRPPGPGPFPLVVINHGTPVSIADARSEKLGFSIASNWFARRGFLVLVAQRPGFGESDGPYLEGSGPCSNRDYVHDGRETAAVEAAIVRTASRLKDVDPQRIIVLGQSAGGFGAIALGGDPPPGVVGVISFAGGRGGDDHEHICSGEDRLVEAAATFGRANRTPQLWLFAANDHFFAPPLAHRMFDAYKAASSAKVRFVDLPPFDGDGHKTLGYADPSVWEAEVSAFLDDVLGRAPQRS